jgi:hypothetical protein
MKNPRKIFFTENQKGGEKFPWAFLLHINTKQCRITKCRKLQKVGNKVRNLVTATFTVQYMKDSRGLFYIKQCN